MRIRINKRIVTLALSILGVIGVGTTSVLSVKCSKKANAAEDKKDKVKAYIPAIASGMATSACIIGSHCISAKEIAALSATCAYAVSNRDKIEKKIREKLGDEKLKEVKEESKKEMIQEPSAKSETWKQQSVEWTGKGTMKFLEGYSGRLFWSSLGEVKRAEKQLNWRFHQGEYVCLNDFYELLGIEKTHFGAEFGWPANDDYYDYDLEEPIHFENTIVEDGDGEPICLIDIYTYPMEAWLEV